MSPANQPIRVVAICEPGATQQQITSALSNQTEFTLADILASTDKLVRQMRSAEPDIILVDHQIGGDPTLDIIDDIALQFPRAAVVAILPSSDPVAAQQVMLAGARGFIVQPFTQINLMSTLRRVAELETRRLQTKAVATAGLPEATRPLRSVTVFSPRGGAGTTTLATNLAVALAEETGGKVLLFEGKMFFGHLEVTLNIRAPNNVSDLIPHATNLDEGLIRDVVIRHHSGIDVLLAPRDLQIAQGVRPDDLYNVFVGVSRLYDFIVVDSGSQLSEVTVTLMDAADRILLLTNPDLPSLQDISRFIQVSRSLGYPTDKILTVLNKANMEGGVKLSDIETVLHYQTYTQIPDDRSNTIRSQNRGVPLFVRYPRSPASRAIRQLARNLIEINLTDTSREAAVPSADKAGREALLASSRLG